MLKITNTCMSKILWECTAQVVERYAPAVPSLVDLHKIDDAEFNHMDFMWAKDARGVVYDYVLGLMKHFDARAAAAAVAAVAN